MKIGYFVEQLYAGVPEEEVIRNGGFFGVRNTHFDPQVGAQLYHRYLAEHIEAERVGYDMLVLNEHHANPACMNHVITIEAAILAYATKRARIATLGVPLPITKNPLRVAEELAMIDMISGGRLVPGIIRGASFEQVASNTNPTQNRELFDEGYEFMIKAWTTPGPWRYEGRHYHYRYVNPWARPIQKTPLVLVPGVISPETVVWAAKHKLPYVALATEVNATLRMWKLYGDTAAEAGYQVGPENFGFLQKLVVADSDEEAYELGKGHMYGGSHATPRYSALPGYNSKLALKEYVNKFYALMNPRAANYMDVEQQRKALLDNYPKLVEAGHIIVGTPKTVIPKLRKVLEALRPGLFNVWGPEGPVPHDKTMRMMTLMGDEVIPALREIGEELGLDDPFERELGSRPLPETGPWRPFTPPSEAAVA
jgi:alkanesulfonate monooxygenase SsuD/methylene tetrahydromethanopterin reductase-like flavin-dependent oxidoreductase (luciferase family)